MDRDELSGLLINTRRKLTILCLVFRKEGLIPVNEVIKDYVKLVSQKRILGTASKKYEV